MENILRLKQEDIKCEKIVNAEVKLDCSHKEESQKPKRTLEELGITDDKYYIVGRKNH